jgi:hypothetical protein
VLFPPAEEPTGESNTDTDTYIPSNIDRIAMAEAADPFCAMLIEEFLMRNGMKDTLSALRSEWARPEDEDSLMLSWQQICLKLRMDSVSDVSRGRTLLENIVHTLIDDAASRTRQKASVLVDGLATLPRVRATAAPAADDTAEMELLLREHPHPKSTIPAAASAPRKTEKPKGSSKGAKKQLKKLHDDIVIDSYGKPKISSENWIPEQVRFRSIERDIAVAKENLKDSMVLEMGSAKEMKRLSQSELARAQMEESLGSKKKLLCGCCNFQFSYINLTLRVSMKAITDIRLLWNTGQPNGYADPDGAKVGNVPRCYNEVGVCRFCAQFFRDQGSYRPSFDKIAYQERKAIHFETVRLEKEYWDPLKMCAKDEERRKLENEGQPSPRLEQQSAGSGDEASWESNSESSPI